MNDCLAHHGVMGMKWGVRRYQPYGSGGYIPKRAKNIYNQAKLKEPKITNAVQKSAKRAGAELYGLKHRLKTQKSISRKLDLGKGINDALRYTTIADDRNFVKSYNDFKKDMAKRGIHEVKCKNYFDLYERGLVKHKSVQSVFEDSDDGYLFEVQFQTPSSQKAKDLKVPIYEERRQKDIDPRRALELEKRMDELAKKVKNPTGYKTIKTYSDI